MLLHNYLNADYRLEEVHGGCGLCRNARVFSDEEIPSPVRFIYYTVMPPKASFGLHRHGHDNEFYIVLEGTGVYTQNGVDVPIRAGDIMMNDACAEHGIVNTGETDMRLLVFEVAIEG